MDPPCEGDEYIHERTFTEEDVRQFAAVSGDRQSQHVEPDEEGRLVVHGLLTATLPTKIGGDLEVLAHTMEFTFHRPVYTGDAITCHWVTNAVDEQADRYVIDVDVTCHDESEETVLTGEITGVVWKETSG